MTNNAGKMHTLLANTYLARRPMVLGLAKVLFLAFGQIPLVRAAPFHTSWLLSADTEDEGKNAKDPTLWLYLGVAAALVLLGGAFAGLTIALMGQDEIYLQVIKSSGEGSERKHAAKVLRLLNRGKHWVLVALLLSNVITNETLPIVLDRSLGGGWPAVLASTILIVIFGEIAPQSVCVRYGLPIGAWMSPFVLFLMYVLAPVAWPTAKLLDYLLGKDHGTVYKKAGLKTLVSLHKTLGDTGQQLNSDEVTIISAVLDLKDKSVGSIMTPMDDVFTLSADDILDEETMDLLLTQGYSRIPIHHPDNTQNFIGMLLVKMLITYDPEDAKPVRDFALATLPETRAQTSCLDIVNFFQEGKSHMVLVSDHPGDDYGAMGVVTLEDVIEELIGEEIIDESDVFIDVHKAIRRLAPAPRTRVPKGEIVQPESPVATAHEGELVDVNESETLSPQDVQRVKTLDGSMKPKAVDQNGSPRQNSLPLRRRSSATDSKAHRYRAAEAREHLKHLGPSNLASRPKATRWNTVKIKPASALGAPGKRADDSGHRTPSQPETSEPANNAQGDVGEVVVASGGKDASDGVQAFHLSYGSLSPTKSRPNTSSSKGVQADTGDLTDVTNGHDAIDGDRESSNQRGRDSTHPRGRDERSRSTIRSLPKPNLSPTYLHTGPARSGSITENIIDANGIRKVVLETTSSSSSEEGEGSAPKKLSPQKTKSSGGREKDNSRASSAHLHSGGDDEDAEHVGDSAAKKKKRRRRKHGHGKGEQEPLLGKHR